nr:phosphoribosylanthranilate isomerase [Uncaria rhynchophylla]
MLSGLNVGTQLQPRATSIPRWEWVLERSGMHSLNTRRTCARNMTTCLLNQQPVFPPDREQKESRPLVKMCGVTSARDAALASEAGADFVGMILWPNSRRSIPLPVAKEISKVARENGAKPVGVFVDDNADTILRVSEATDLEFVQLHGNGSRMAFPIVRRENRVIFVLHANEDGSLLNSISDEDCSLVDWILVDSAKGGSGKGFNWSRFKLPPITSKHGWLLAGGINPMNVSEALSALKPHGVDVSSGICGPDGIQKDESLMLSFMNAVRFVNHQ